MLYLFLFAAQFLDDAVVFGASSDCEEVCICHNFIAIYAESCTGAWSELFFGVGDNLCV